MKKKYQKFLWSGYLTLGVVSFLIGVSVIVGTVFLWVTTKDLPSKGFISLLSSFKGFMSLLSCAMILCLCIQIYEIMPSRWSKKKKEIKEEIEIKSDDWMEHTWLPLKRNIKRKEFWILQLWPLGKICSYAARLIFDLIIYTIGIFGTAYYLLSSPNRVAASDIFVVLATVLFVMFLYILGHLLLQIIRQKLTMRKLFKSLFDFIVLGSILITLIECVDHSGKTVEGLKDFLTMFIQVINEHMYLFVAGCFFALIGYVFTKLIKRLVEKEIEIDLIPTFSGYEYYVDYGKYEGLIYTHIVHASIQEFTVKGLRFTLKDGQKKKAIDRRKEVYNFYEVEAFLRYGIGELWLNGSHIPQNKPYIGWKSDALEATKKLPVKEEEAQ